MAICFFQADDGIRDGHVTGVQTCALPIYAAHERGVFAEVTQARARAATPGASPAQQAQHEDFLSAALGRLFAVAENYPQLRAAESFVQLQQELTNTEDRIAAGRRFYNANVRRRNTKVEVFPHKIIPKTLNLLPSDR